MSSGPEPRPHAILTVPCPESRTAPARQDGDLHKKSKARDSQQATVGARGGHTNWDNAAARLQARAVALANDLSGYSLQVQGQEELMAIQYLEGQQYHVTPRPSLLS